MLKWLSLVLLAYVATLFVVKVDWLALARSIVLPRLSFDADYLSIVVETAGTKKFSSATRVDICNGRWTRGELFLAMSFAISRSNPKAERRKRFIAPN
ncbi:hypothetical protein [Bosea sp. TAF32]|uniref:hypothetical protein n=1 Tax=Bosea sp. TAF32 TaxID=3237482 RepID=UPI003F8E9E60